MSRPHRTPAQWRSTSLVAIVLLLAGAYLLGRGLVTGVPLVFGGSEEEQAQRESGLIQLAIGCGLLALLGLPLAVAGGRAIAAGLVVAAAATYILGLAWLGWAWLSALALAALALGGTLWVLVRWREARGESR